MNIVEINIVLQRMLDISFSKIISLLPVIVSCKTVSAWEH